MACGVSSSSMIIHNDNYVQSHTVVVRRQQVSNDDKDLALGGHLNDQWFSLQWATTTMMNSASVRLQEADNGSAFNEQWFEGISKGRWSESVRYFVALATPIFRLSSPKYANAVLDVWRQPGIYLHDFFLVTPLLPIAA